jgi:hypothetical protein
MLPGGVIALIVVAVVVGGAFAFGAPVVAIPVVAVFLLGWLTLTALPWILERRRRLRHEHVEFTDEDKPTLTPSATPGDVHIVRDDP